MRLVSKYLFATIGMIFLLFSTNYSFCQIKEGDSTYKIKFKSFSPPVSAVIEDMIYSPAKVFQAPDINGRSHNLLSYRGKMVLLWFWKSDCDICIDNLDVLFNVKKNFGDKLELFAFSNDIKTNLVEYFDKKTYNYNVMYNSKVFGEMMYGGSLGYPRLFIINKEGYIVRVLPEEYFSNTTDLSNEIIKMINEYNLYK
jgi:peroxiredoxin